ncbi:MAG TPA: hypothetical protein VM387_14875 [Gemmatimonadales bacterium]|nr:hypothetical protein [Gemmatimonadales bacterium]
MSPALPPGTPGSPGHIGWVVAGSLAAGLFFALLLAFAPFIPPKERDVMGAVLCGFALGWAMLAVLSTRFTDQPQRWAVVPAAFMGLGGLLLLAFGSGVDKVLSWVWPPALLALVIWMVIRARHQLHSPTRRWLLYPVFAVHTLLHRGHVPGPFVLAGHSFGGSTCSASRRTFPMRSPAWCSSTPRRRRPRRPRDRRPRDPTSR